MKLTRTALLFVVAFAAAGQASANPLPADRPEARQTASAGAEPAAAGAPIVSGRSVSARHKSKMHHVRTRPDEPDSFADSAAQDGADATR